MLRQVYGAAPASAVKRADRPETAADRLEKKQKEERKARREAQRARARCASLIVTLPSIVDGADIYIAARTPRKPLRFTPALYRSRRGHAAAVLLSSWANYLPSRSRCSLVLTCRFPCSRSRSSLPHLPARVFSFSCVASQALVPVSRPILGPIPNWSHSALRRVQCCHFCASRRVALSFPRLAPRVPRSPSRPSLLAALLSSFSLITSALCYPDQKLGVLYPLALFLYALLLYSRCQCDHVPPYRVCTGVESSG